MRLPRYARGLTLVRFGMFAMLLNFGLSAYVMTKLIGGSTADDIHSMLTWTRYALWVNIAAFGLMLLGSAVALPDLLVSKIPPLRLVVSILGFAAATGALVWSNHALSALIDVLKDPDASLLELSEAIDRVDNTKLSLIIRDLAYPVGLVALLRSIRDTAVANDHYMLRDASSQVTSLVVGLAILDILYQLMASAGVLSMSFLLAVVVGIAGGLALICFWVYIHLRLAKFLKAAAILVNEPHNLPVARLVIRDAEPFGRAAIGRAAIVEVVEPESDIPVIRASAPNIRQSGPMRARNASGPPAVSPTAAPTFAPAPSMPAPRMPAPPHPPAAPSGPAGPVLTVAAELRSAPVPRAETAPGAPVDEPKLLR